MVAVKDKSLLLEIMAQQSFKKENTLLPKEKKWMGTYTFRDKNKVFGRPNINPRWRLRDIEVVFQAWWRSQGKATIFFDDASKGNLGMARAYGVIYSSDGIILESFSWGLGQKTNNYA